MRAAARIAWRAGNVAGTVRAGEVARDAERRARRAGLRPKVGRWRRWSSTRRERRDRDSGGSWGDILSAVRTDRMDDQTRVRFALELTPDRDQTLASRSGEACIQCSV